MCVIVLLRYAEAQQGLYMFVRDICEWNTLP